MVLCYSRIPAWFWEDMFGKETFELLYVYKATLKLNKLNWITLPPSTSHPAHYFQSPHSPSHSNQYLLTIKPYSSGLSLAPMGSLLIINVHVLWFVRASMIRATRVRTLWYCRWLNREILSASLSPGLDPRQTLLRASRFVQILKP